MKNVKDNILFSLSFFSHFHGVGKDFRSSCAVWNDWGDISVERLVYT